MDQNHSPFILLSCRLWDSIWAKFQPNVHMYGAFMEQKCTEDCIISCCDFEAHLDVLLSAVEDYLFKVLTDQSRPCYELKGLTVRTLAPLLEHSGVNVSFCTGCTVFPWLVSGVVLSHTILFLFHAS